MAEDVGKKLLGEIDEVGLDEVLQSIRVGNGTTAGPFNFPPLDDLLRTLSEARPATRTTAPQPIVELMSLAPGGGTTHLIYHLCAQAVLPRELGGKHACAAVVDTDGRFSVTRLADQIGNVLRELHVESLRDEGAIDGEILSALKHVHIFRPQSLAATTGTLDALPGYLFNQNRHYSYDRAVAFVAIDSGSAFYWQDRAETEDAAFQASTERFSSDISTESGYVELVASLRAAMEALCCPAIVTSWHLGLIPSAGQPMRSFRPQLPAFYPALRFVVHRLAVRKFPQGISMEQALREAADRQKAVAEGKCWCFINEWGMDERLLRTIAPERRAFHFRIDDRGMSVGETDPTD